MDYLAWPDYLILVAFLIISVGIGVYHSLTGGRQKTTSEFIMANRSLKVFPTTLSLLVSFQSAVIMMGMTAEMYSYGSQFLIMSMVSFTLGIILTMQVAVPWFYRLKLVSINEYLELRFKSRAIRIIAAIFSILAAFLIMGTVMYAPSAALEAATGLPIVVSIPVMTAVTIAYTALGGVRAVIWTDVFQCAIMIAGMTAILIKGLVVVGGFGNVFRLCGQSGRLNWIDWSPNPTVRLTIWGFLFGRTTSWFSVYGFSQSGAQRYMATKTMSQAKLTVVLNLPGYYVIHFIACLTGLVVVAYYTSTDCDPLARGEIRSINQLLPHFVVKMFADAPGFAGLFLATLYGGALSSLSSMLSGASANCWEDILQWKLMHWSESRKVLLNRIIVIVFGVTGCGLAFIASFVPGPVTQVIIALNTTVSGPFIGMFLLGGLNRHANAKGALIGGITSLIGSFWLTIGSIMMKRSHPTLPPLRVDRCMAPNNLTLPNYDDTNSSSIFHFIDQSPINATMTYFRPLTNQTIQTPLHGLEHFYSISYLWYSTLWISVTIIVGTVASFLFNDRTVEEKVDEKLLINFRQCFRCRSDSTFDSRTEKNSDISYTKVEIRAEENGVGEEVVEPCLQPTAEEASSATIPLKRTNDGEKNGESKTQTDV